MLTGVLRMRLAFSSLLLSYALAQEAGTQKQRSLEASVADIAIWGATICGITGAIAASRMNASVILLQPDGHVGGMTTGGLRCAF